MKHINKSLKKKKKKKNKYISEMNPSRINS